MEKNMFKRILALITAICMMTMCFAGCSKPEKDDPVSIIFATDMHYFSPDLTDGGEFFKNAIAQGDGKVIEYSAQINDAFFAEVIDKKPDLLVLGGDLTLNGSVQSHKEFVEKLQKVQDSGVQVLVIPGNHDVDNENAMRYLNDSVEYVDYLTSVGFSQFYEKFGPMQSISRDEASFSYMYKASENLRILMIDANCFGRGFVKDSTLEWLKTVLEDAKNDRADVITVTHQNLFTHSPLLSFGYQLYNADKVIELFKEYKVKLNLSGHIHIQNIMTENKITEIVTSALEMAPIQYGELTYNGSEVTYSVQKTDVSGWAKTQGLTDYVFNDFEKYATEYFEYTSKLKIFNSDEDISLTEEEKELLAQTFARANTYYFAGEKFDADEFSDGMKLLENNEKLSFYKSYLSSILDTANNEKKSITIKF